jgi:hypothetical protein
MTITITLENNVLAGLQQKAQRQHVTVEELAVKILAAAVEESEPMTPEEVVARIKANPPNPAMIRPATGSLADLLRSAPEDPDFNLAEWERNWATVEREIKGDSKDRFYSLCDLAESGPSLRNSQIDETLYGN